MNYTNFSSSHLKEVEFKNVALNSASFQGITIKNVEFKDVELVQAQFFETSLKGIDFTTCNLEGLITSTKDIYGAIVTLYQAAELSKLLGLIIK